MSPFCSVSSLQGTLSHLSGGTEPPPAHPPVPSHHPRGTAGPPGVTPGSSGAYLGDSAWKLNLRRAAFIWGERGGVTGTPPSPSHPKSRMGWDHPSLTFFSSLLTASTGSPRSDKLGRVSGLRVSAKSRVSPAGELGVPHGRAWGTRGAQGGSPLPGAAWLQSLASRSPPRSMLGVAGKRWVTGGLHSRWGDRGLLWGDSGSGQG